MNEYLPCVVTDSTADIPPEITRNLGITVVPCHVHFGEQTFREGVDLTRTEFYRRLRGPERFTTSQPAAGVFAETYQRLLAEGRHIISIHLASRLSGVYNSASLAAAETDPERVTVIDSQQVSMCVGFLAMHAAEAVQAGCSTQEIIRQIHELPPRLRLFAVIDDLHSLQRSGRVNWASSLLGSLFSIKPIILIKEGRVDLAGKVRSLTRGFERVATLVAGLGPPARLAVLHADAPTRALELADHLADIFPRDKMLITEAGSIVSGHAGPGAVGVACLMAG